MGSRTYKGIKYNVIGRKELSARVSEVTGLAENEIDYVIRVFLDEIKSHMKKGFVIQLKTYLNLFPKVFKGRRVNNHLPKDHPKYGIIMRPYVFYQCHVPKDVDSDLRRLDTDKF